MEGEDGAGWEELVCQWGAWRAGPGCCMQGWKSVWQ